jgi:cell wall-associated NlpC family hydrolase
MFARGQARAGEYTRVTRAVGACVALSLVLLAALTVQTAGATSLASLRAQARAAEARINALNVAAEKKIEAYDGVHGKLISTRKQLAATKLNLRLARANLAASQRQLAHSLAAEYKAGGQDPLMYVLAAKSFGDLVDEMQLLQRRNSTDAQLVRSIAHYRATVRTAVHKLSVENAKLTHETSQAKQARDAAISSLNTEKHYSAGLNSKIQSVIAAQQAAAAAAAARAAAAAQAAPPAGGTGGSAPSGPPIPPPPGSSLGAKAVAIAQQYLGVPYVWGGASPSGFDCSGLVMYVYGQLGVSLPHNAAAQYASLPHVPLNDLQPGDLVFFYGFGHVGIYVGGGEMIHAPHTGAVVSYASISGEGPISGAARVP